MKKPVGNRKLPQKSKGKLRSSGALQNIQLNNSLQSQLLHSKGLSDLLPRKLSLPNQCLSSSLGNQSKFRNQALVTHQTLN